MCKKIGEANWHVSDDWLHIGQHPILSSFYDQRFNIILSKYLALLIGFNLSHSKNFQCWKRVRLCGLKSVCMSGWEIALKPQCWPSQSRKESILNFLLIEQATLFIGETSIRVVTSKDGLRIDILQLEEPQYTLLWNVILT